MILEKSRKSREKAIEKTESSQEEDDADKADEEEEAEEEGDKEIMSVASQEHKDVSTGEKTCAALSSIVTPKFKKLEFSPAPSTASKDYSLMEDDDLKIHMVNIQVTMKKKKIEVELRKKLADLDEKGLPETREKEAELASKIKVLEAELAIVMKATEIDILEKRDKLIVGAVSELQTYAVEQYKANDIAPDARMDSTLLKFSL